MYSTRTKNFVKSNADEKLNSASFFLCASTTRKKRQQICIKAWLELTSLMQDQGAVYEVNPH